MKWKFLLLLVFSCCVFINSNSQTVTLSEKNCSLKKVFRKIENQTGYFFVYRDEWLSQSNNVDIEVKKGDLKAVLEICFRNQPITFTIVDKLIVIKRKTA